MVDVALLGTGGMMPMPERFLSSILLRINGRLIMTDCGEGTQVTLKMLGWGFKAIDTICFTHFHADHISGLPGMLLTIGNSGRKEPVTLVGPVGLKRVVEGLRVICPELPFKIEYLEIEDASQVNDFGDFKLSTCEGEHRIRCFAYRFDIPRKGKFSVEKAQNIGIPVNMWSILQKGCDVEYKGKVYTSDMVLGDERRGISISFCTDTRPVAALGGFVKDSDLFICEGMYGDNDKLQKAVEYKHMLFSEAAKLARIGKVNELWLTHSSPSLSEPEEYIDNAKSIFKNTSVGYDRMTKRINFSE
ncbi:Ribonuclease Z [bioreactor metagenome]|uniref:Ribonuclease Z n=1 Tax=bioreactor metagenome TaxID=1076179 RepID=A0A645CIL6_9ZZZZ